MEYYQAIQNRAGQTVAVINENIPTLSVGGVSSAQLLAQSQALTALAQTRDTALDDADAANNTESLGFLTIQALTLALPRTIEGELSEDLPAESALLDLLAPVYGINPSTTELALERGQKLGSALTKINAYLTATVPPRPAITSGGKGLTQLNAALIAQPALEQALEDRIADVATARTALRTAATAVDRLNKRFFARLQSEARTNPALAAALGQITTESGNQPGTLGIKSIVQGGTDGLHLLLSYVNGTYNGSATSTVEWMVVGLDPSFTHDVPADPSGNVLGPFAVGQVVKLRTRVVNSNGTTTGSIRTLSIAAP
jgi:hypothetical protein